MVMLCYIYWNSWNKSHSVFYYWNVCSKTAVVLYQKDCSAHNSNSNFNYTWSHNMGFQGKRNMPSFWLALYSIKQPRWKLDSCRICLHASWWHTLLRLLVMSFARAFLCSSDAKLSKENLANSNCNFHQSTLFVCGDGSASYCRIVFHSFIFQLTICSVKSGLNTIVQSSSSLLGHPTLNLTDVGALSTKC